jgi:hypothetical protein
VCIKMYMCVFGGGRGCIHRSMNDM